VAANPFANHSIRAQIAALAASSIDWRYVWLQATRHGIRPLVYSNLRSLNLAANGLEAFRPEVRECAASGMYMFAELMKLLEIFERNGIRAIPFKGPILALTAFGDVSQREFSDLDVLIQEHDLHRACELLLNSGFRLTSSLEWLAPYLAFGHELGFINAQGSYEVDLQWRFGKKWLSFPITPASMWSRTERSSIAGHAFLQPCPEDTLLILCGHGYRHCWSHLKWIADISAFLHTFGPRLDWNGVVDHASRYGGRRLLGLGIWLAQQLGPVCFAASNAGKELVDEHVTRLGASIMLGLFDEADKLGPHGAHTLSSRMTFHWHTRERVAEKIPELCPLMAHLSYVVRRYVRRHTERVLQHARRTLNRQ
jgi:hypothetical protein